VGLFVLAALTVFGILLLWFGEAPAWLGGNEWTLKIVGVRELRGIEAGSPVLLNGVEIGRVRRLEFANPERPDRGVVVVAGIQDQYSVPIASHARVYGATLGFGTGHVDVIVNPGESPELLPKDDAVIEGEMRDIVQEIIPKQMVANLDRAVTNIADFAEAAAPAAKNFAILFEPRPVGELEALSPDERPQPNLSTAIERIDMLAADLHAVIGDADTQGEIKSGVSDLRESVRLLRETAETLRTSSQRIAESVETGTTELRADLDASFTNLNQVLDRLDTSALNLAQATQQIAAGEGTIGMLVKDPRLYEAAVISFERLSDSLMSLKAILAEIERRGYITIGKAPTGTLRKDVPLSDVKELIEE
jgi:ABC-type transporter Mla subunit MlaD